MVTPGSLYVALQNFATQLTVAYSPGTVLGAQPEAQLTGPVELLIKHYANVDTVREVPMPGVGRPDLGISVLRLLTGYIELKPPGKGANPDKFRDAHDKKQWSKFKSLPNLLYTDGQEWALYRNGIRQGPICRMTGDVTTDGLAATTAANADKLFLLLRDFLSWNPIVPSQPRALAEMLAPLCRLLRDDVTEVLLADPHSPLNSLYEDWKKYFFPDADFKQFADAYAQTLTYALLLARVSGAASLEPTKAADTIRTRHGLLADTLDVLSQRTAYQQVKVPLDLLRRTIEAVDPTKFSGSAADPWLYFYEDFLGAYDPAMRKQRGVYYTPVEVVQAQVRLVDELLRVRLGAKHGFVDPAVATLDPACGTGTYLLAALRYGLDQAAVTYGEGFRAQAATTAAQQLYAFELLVGPYAVAHLRLTQQVLAAGGTLPTGGINVLLADTLESPHTIAPGHLPLPYKALSEEHVRAQHVKANVPILVCIGNPPYYREQQEAGAPSASNYHHGGWVRYGDRSSPKAGNRSLLQDFLDPLTALGAGLHAKNLYNDYVYFWRWALWKVFEQPSHHTGIVSFITASSYLRGPGFAGMRQVMRETFEELWIINLEGDNLGARKTSNVFAIQTPVCIAIGIRTNNKVAGQPATVRYCRLTGSDTDKLAQLGGIKGFADLVWQNCPTGWTDAMLPATVTAYASWPLLTDIFPWQANGLKVGRTWPIGPTTDVLTTRWQTLLSHTNRDAGFKNSPTGRRANQTITAAAMLPGRPGSQTAIQNVAAGTPINAEPYAFRSFDRQFILADARLIDRTSPTLWRAHGPQQVYMTSFITAVLGEGPAAVATELIPDLDHFRGSFGAKHVIPLYRDAAGTMPNLPASLLPILNTTYGVSVQAADVLAYAYAILATPHYVELFWEELEAPGPRLPFTANGNLFQEVAAVGRALLQLHTWGNRFGTANSATPVPIPRGKAQVAVGTPGSATAYPNSYSYDEATHTLSIGEGPVSGRFTGVTPDVMNYSVSGLPIVDSWLGYRMLDRSGKASSVLDNIRPATWTFDLELVELLWVLEATLSTLPTAAILLDQVVDGPLLLATTLPTPTVTEREGPGLVPILATGNLFEPA
jgi:hypothetical protein